MSQQIFKSTAQVVFVMGEHIQDVQILIDNEELYNNLPGKFEAVSARLGHLKKLGINAVQIMPVAEFAGTVIVAGGAGM